MMMAELNKNSNINNFLSGTAAKHHKKMTLPKNKDSHREPNEI